MSCHLKTEHYVLEFKSLYYPANEKYKCFKMHPIIFKPIAGKMEAMEPSKRKGSPRSKLVAVKGPSTLATLFNHMWPRFCGGPEHTRATCMLCMQTLCLWRGRATACRTLEPQTAVCLLKLENNGFLRE